MSAPGRTPGRGYPRKSAYRCLWHITKISDVMRKKKPWFANSVILIGAFIGQ
jgi:hypothetical protein